MSKAGAIALGTYIGAQMAGVERRNRERRRANLRARFKAARPIRIRSKVIR